MCRFEAIASEIALRLHDERAREGHFIRVVYVDPSTRTLWSRSRTEPGVRPSGFIFVFADPSRQSRFADAWAILSKGRRAYTTSFARWRK